MEKQSAEMLTTYTNSEDSDESDDESDEEMDEESD